jgi:hypothetical protein
LEENRLPRLDANDLELLRDVAGYLERLKDPFPFTGLAGTLHEIGESVPGAIEKLRRKDIGILEDAAALGEHHVKDLRAAAAIVKSLLGAPL